MKLKNIKLQNNILNITSLFLKNKLDLDVVKSFIVNNIDLFVSDECLAEHIYFIYNSNEIYSLLYINDDILKWSLFSNNKFGKLNDSLNSDDLIIDMVLNFYNTEKVKKAIPEIVDKNMEGKVKILKKIGFNSQGYHIN